MIDDAERRTQLRKYRKGELIVWVLRLEDRWARYKRRRDPVVAQRDEALAEVERLKAALAAPHGAVEADVVRWLRERGHVVHRQPVA